MAREMTAEHKAAMLAGRKAAKKGGGKRVSTPLAAIRAHCLSCCETRNAVKFCTCDGVNSTRCHLWPFRFGKRPATILKGPDACLLDPEQMPDAGVAQEDCKEASDAEG
ncbi:MAG TPA: hypothetical protein VMZ06_08415 [Candidatus Bathyarchaeia archaeon]|nr:hypothetical protein [Phycisphaerae bacterium]HUW61015.1 hypothetical protein [Candidatus Bathyarchaeia archaeon]HUW99420.1 hypothetical protein [Phycisphaerae bacterium]